MVLHAHFGRFGVEARRRGMADLSTESKMNAFEELAGQAMLAEGHGIVKVAEG